jgi:Xaa-Pro aminopeptidase
MGARVAGYHSDLTRTFYLGAEGSEQFWAVYNGVLAAQTAVFQSAAAGMPLPDVDALARNSIAAAGYGDYFGHGLGHGLGLEIHEAPFLSPRADIGAQLLPGMNVTIEPGIYIPGLGRRAY